MRARRTGVTVFHAGSASAALRTARSISVVSANNTWRTTWPVEGFVTSPRRVPCDDVRTPPIQNGTSAPMRADDSARMALVGPMIVTPESGGGLRHDARKTTRHYVQRLV